MQPYYVARLGAVTRPDLLAYSENHHIQRELRQYQEFVWIDLAHAVMLGETGIVTEETAAHLVNGIQRLHIGETHPEDRYTDAVSGSLLLQMEEHLAGLVGKDVAGQLHTARSRLDQGPAARRLYKRRRCLDIIDALARASVTIGKVTERHAATLMPGYTCLQHAHPTTFGHYLSAVGDRLLEQGERMTECYGRVNRSPLGGVGLSGTTWPIDRGRIATLLGFSGVVHNARRCRDAYYAAEIVAVLATIMSVLYDLATDLCIWSSSEFALVDIDVGFCSTSSVFPNKKNPTALDSLRAKAGAATQWFGTTLASFRGTGTSDVVMQEVELLDEAFEVTESSLALVAEIVATLIVRQDRMEQAARSSWATVGFFADWLFRIKGIPYRSGYTLMATVVRHCAERGRGQRDVDAAAVHAAANEIGLSIHVTDAEVRAALDPARFVEAARSEGGCSSQSMHELTRRYRAESLKLGQFVSTERERAEAAWLATIAAARDLTDNFNLKREQA